VTDDARPAPGGESMEFIAELQTPAFWTGLLTIIWVNVILSGDNAVVIALAARSLPKRQQSKAVFWGAGAAVVLRIVLTIGAVELLRLPYLKIIGGILLLWIAVKLLLPEEEEGGVEGSASLLQAIKTILIADLVMSLDNVLAVAAVARDSIMLLVIGLALSIPLVVFGATLLMKLMVRYPIIITIGAALLGWVAGEMLVGDPILAPWIAELSWLHFRLPEISWIAVGGAAFVVVLGKWLAARVERGRDKFEDLAVEHDLID
jgi:YjbE family integral membrane protein